MEICRVSFLDEVCIIYIYSYYPHESPLETFAQVPKGPLSEKLQVVFLSQIRDQRLCDSA